MALQLPILRDVTVSEKRSYKITYGFCNLGISPNDSGLFAKAFPRFARPAMGFAFFDELPTQSATPVRRFFSAGDILWRRTGSRSGPPTQEQPQGGQYAVYTRAPDVSMPISLSGRVITVTIPFGTSFSRLLIPNGLMSDDDTDTRNDPAFYYYGVGDSYQQLGGGIINVTIDLSTVTPPPPVTPETPSPPATPGAAPSLCSIEVA